MSLYPTRDRHFNKATEKRLKDDSRKHVYGSHSDSLLVSQSYPELASPNPHSNTNSNSNSKYPPTRNNCWSAINIQNYSIIKKIGSGTYGSVFHARSPAGCDVAIKQLCSMQNDKHLQDGFHITAIREIKILKSLHHTNIISLHDVICCKENVMCELHDENKKDKHKFLGNRMQTYMIFEYMHHDLSGLLHNDLVSFNIRHIKYFLSQILNALQYCHETALILHRDIKSSNLLVDKYGVVKIADFGLSRQFIPELQICGAKRVRIAQQHESVNNHHLNIQHPRHYTNRVVTLWYRAPELLLSDVHYTPAVDLWSVGCVFAELLCNKPIFTGKNEMEQWFQIIEVCGWNSSHHVSWMNTLRDKDNLIAKMKKKSKVFSRKLKAKFVKFLSKKTAPNDKYLDEHGFNLLDSLLTINPNKRCSAKEALQSEWFRSEPFPKPPQLDRIQPSHDYEQRQQRKNPNYRNHHSNNNNNNSNRRYQYSYNNNNNHSHGNTARTKRDRSRSRSRSRSRDRNKSNNSNVIVDRSRSGSFDTHTHGKDNSVSLPPPIQRKPSIHAPFGNVSDVKQVVTLSAPSLRAVSTVNAGNRVKHETIMPKNGCVGSGYRGGYNPDKPQTFYSRFKKLDDLKGRSRF